MSKIFYLGFVLAVFQPVRSAVGSVPVGAIVFDAEPGESPSTSGTTNSNGVDSSIPFTAKGASGAAVISPAKNGVLYEIWRNIEGTLLVNLKTNSRFPSNPDSTEILRNFASEKNNFADNYGARLRTYYRAPLTGPYTFYLSGDNQCELWISEDNAEANARRILAFTADQWTLINQYDKYINQVSTPIHLVRGGVYFMQALMKEGTGYDQVSVGVKLPNQKLERPIQNPNLFIGPSVPALPASKTVTSSAPKTSKTPAVQPPRPPMTSVSKPTGSPQPGPGFTSVPPTVIKPETVLATSTSGAVPVPTTVAPGVTIMTPALGGLATSSGLLPPVGSMPTIPSSQPISPSISQVLGSLPSLPVGATAAAPMATASLGVSSTPRGLSAPLNVTPVPGGLALPTGTTTSARAPSGLPASVVAKPEAAMITPTPCCLAAPVCNRS